MPQTRVWIGVLESQLYQLNFRRFFSLPVNFADLGPRYQFEKSLISVLTVTILTYSQLSAKPDSRPFYWGNFLPKLVKANRGTSHSKRFLHWQLFISGSCKTKLGYAWRKWINMYQRWILQKEWTAGGWTQFWKWILLSFIASNCAHARSQYAQNVSSSSNKQTDTEPENFCSTQRTLGELTHRLFSWRIIWNLSSIGGKLIGSCERRLYLAG